MAPDPRGSREERGYGPAHRRERKRYGRLVEADEAHCAQCGDWIAPEAKWFLGHDHKNGGYAGPEHADCGVRERNRRHAKARAASESGRALRRVSRDWLGDAELIGGQLYRPAQQYPKRREQC
jgi:hypothetical protein